MKNVKKLIPGITLIALVVTVVVLLILAGISIRVLSGDNGIINQAKKGKEETEIAFEIGYTQGNKVRNLAYKYLGEDINVSVEKDYSDKDRFVFIWNV